MEQLATELHDPVKTNLSSDKVLRIMEAMAYHADPLSLGEIAEIVGMNITTTRRFITSLCNAGYASRDQNKNYFLTLKLCTLANKVQSHLRIKDVCKPFLKSLSSVFAETVNLGIERNHKLLYIDSIEPAGQSIKMVECIGSTAPLHCTGQGKLFLLNYSNEDLKILMRSSSIQPLTKHTIVQYEDLLYELKRIREQGYAFDNEEYELGARCVAAPIKNYKGEIFASISVSGPSTRMTDAFLFSKLPYLVEACQNISRIYGEGH